MNERKRKYLLVKKLELCSEEKDYVLVLNNKVISSTQHLYTRKSLEMLKIQAIGIINPYNLIKRSENHWANNDKTLIIRKFKNSDLIANKN